LHSIMDKLNSQVGVHDSLAVFPEGAMLNYLSNKSNPEKYFCLNPFDLNLFGETNVIESMASHPPRWIMLMMRTVREYGHTFLCDSYGQELCAWIKAHYTVAGEIGTIPFQFGKFGAVLLKRNDAVAQRAEKGAARPSAGAKARE